MEVFEEISAAEILESKETVKLFVKLTEWTGFCTEMQKAASMTCALLLFFTTAVLRSSTNKMRFFEHLL